MFVDDSSLSAEEPMPKKGNVDRLIGWATVSGNGVETTTGGGDSEVVTVRSVDELKKAASSDEPLVIRLDGTFAGNGNMEIASNKTLIGVGADATIKGMELSMNGVSNIIIRNLTISDSRDAIALRRTHHVWVDHCDLSNCSDGLLDITNQSDYVTVSWTRFSKHHKTMLINSGTSHSEDSGTLNTTIHHCWFDGSDTRNPRAGYGRVHVFNCLYNDNDYGIGLHSQCLVLAEQNYFANVKDPIKQMYRPDPNDIHHGFCQSVDNIFNECRGSQDDEGKSFKPTDFYQYDSVLDKAADVPAIVKAGVGPSQRFETLSLANSDDSASVSDKPRVIVTTDGEIDDECSMVRFLLYANEFDVEAIVTSSSQYHWQGHRWAGDDWIDPLLDAYAEVYPNLKKHDATYPTPEYLRSRTALGNVKSEGDMEAETAGSQLIVKVLLDESDDRPIWLQAWGGPNTIARALKTIEEKHPEKMAAVAQKMRFYLIWEQDDTYQKYIRPHWGKFNIPTIISDQFIAFAYERQRKTVPQEVQRYFSAEWMNENALKDRGPLLDSYKAHEDGRFRSEGDSPAFLHVIPTGLRSGESPDWGGWGGRFVKVRENTWLDPVAEPEYEYPAGRWFGSSAWGRLRAKREVANDPELTAYLKPQWRWIDAIQNDFAARADWCVKSYDKANHPPTVKLTHEQDLKVRVGDRVELNAEGTTDPDGNALTYRWWQYEEADSAESRVSISDANSPQASFVVPNEPGKQVHIVLEVTDNGTPSLVRYRRVVCSIGD